MPRNGQDKTRTATTTTTTSTNMCTKQLLNLLSRVPQMLAKVCVSKSVPTFRLPRPPLKTATATSTASLTKTCLRLPML
ncbi:hypothetical protein E2C01_097510 [Portunus trituberculatus]|uniref:Uncharacterized protein n=1 Tax=Portunus trituberculatus TaxID=210409 RepID=A0A5B7K9T2_PORTR|nr:hypothetical protein [Portunus trituberculatus]